MEKEHEFLTVEQAAELLQVKSTTIREWLKKGKLPGVKVGRLWRVDREGVYKILRKGG